MKTLKPSICKSEGLLSLCDCTGENIKEEQIKCLTFKQGKEGYCEYYRSSISACSNYDGSFSIDENR